MKKLKKGAAFALLTSCLFGHSLFAADSSVEGMDTLGNVVAAWEEFDSGVGYAVIKVATKPAASSTWSSPTMISGNTAASAYTPFVAINDNGNAIVGWLEDDPVNGVVAVNSSQFLFGGTWTSPDRASATNENVSGFVQLTISDTIPASATAVWTANVGSNSFSSVRAATTLFGGSWSNPVTISSQ